MTGQLQLRDSGGEPAVCQDCGAQAVGPCARCHAPVCGDCCVLTESSAKTWAICLRCDRAGGRSLSGAWRAIMLWLALPIFILVALVVLIELIRP